MIGKNYKTGLCNDIYAIVGVVAIYIGLNVCCTHGQRYGVGDNNTQQRPDQGCGEDRQVQGDFFNQGLSLESSIISPV